MLDKGKQILKALCVYGPPLGGVSTAAAVDGVGSAGIVALVVAGLYALKQESRDRKAHEVAMKALAKNRPAVVESTRDALKIELLGENDGGAQAKNREAEGGKP